MKMPSWMSSRGNGSEAERALDRLEALDAQLGELRRAELERIASFSAEEARQALVEEVEVDARRQAVSPCAGSRRTPDRRQRPAPARSSPPRHSGSPPSTRCRRRRSSCGCRTTG